MRSIAFNNKTREITFGSIGREDQRKKRRNVACVEQRSRGGFY